MNMKRLTANIISLMLHRLGMNN
jgi:hypothetical protein